MYKKFKRSSFYEILSYLVVGGLTTLVNLLVYFVLNQGFGVHYLWANATAILLSILFAYVTNKYFVFQSKQKDWPSVLREMIRFFSFRALSAFLDMASLWLMVGVFHWPSSFSKLASQIIVVILNYIFSKCFVFNKG